VKFEHGAGHWWNDTGETPSARRKTCPSAILSTTNPTWAALGFIPGLHGERLVTNSLSP
jgi:hypothetical protein